jgi:hypothetical protein
MTLPLKKKREAEGRVKMEKAERISSAILPFVS